MDETLDVDDLFGDSGGLELSLTTAVASKALPARIDELRLLGCCQKIAWSKMGAIAYIGPDGTKAYLQHLSCNPENGKWGLSDRDPEHPIAEAQSGHTLVHLSWNEAGGELAVVDSCGRISILNITIALNAIIFTRSATMDPDDDGNQAVGLMWLPLNRPGNAFSHAVKAGGRWSYMRYQRRSMKPFNGPKPALMVVTRSGKLRVLYQNPDSKWGEVVVEMHSTGYTNDNLTHAAMAPTDGAVIMVVTYSASNELRLYRAQLRWEIAQAEPVYQRPNNPLAIPTIHLVHIEVEEPHVASPLSTYGLDSTENTNTNANGLCGLTHLQMITGPMDSSGVQTAPVILAVFSYPIQILHGRSHVEHSSVLARWEFSPVTQNLHRSFDNITSKQTGHPLLPVTELMRQADLYFERHIVSIDFMEAGGVLALTLEDSSIAFYDTKSFTPISGHDVETVTSLPQSGFTFPPAISPDVHISFSPSGCIAATLDEKSHVQIRIMEHLFGAENGLFNDGKFMSALAALTIAYSRACSADNNNDDVLMIVMQQLNVDSHKNFINEVYRALQMNVDFTSEQDKFMNNPFILKCFSMQAALGFRTRLESRNLAAAVPWVTLQLRQISILLAYFHFRPGAETECHDPEILRITLGNVKWTLDLAKYIVDDLFEISNNVGGQTNNQECASSSGKQCDSLSVILLIASIPRAFLKYICRCLRGTASGVINVTNFSSESYQVYSQIVTIIAESKLKVEVFEKLLAYIENDVKQAYKSAGFTNSDRAATERDLIVTGSIPPVLQPAVTSILTKTMPAVRSDINPMYLFLQDYSWLGIADDERTNIYRRRYELDILRKVLIPLDEPGMVQRTSRRCVRCCSVSEDILPKSVAAIRMLMKTVVLRACTCGGMWTVSNANRARGSTVPG